MSVLICNSNKICRVNMLLQCIAMCCSVWHCVAVYRTVLQCVVAVCCCVHIVLQLQYVAGTWIRLNLMTRILLVRTCLCVAVCCRVLQYVAVCCSLLQYLRASQLDDTYIGGAHVAAHFN